MGYSLSLSLGTRFYCKRGCFAGVLGCAGVLYAVRYVGGHVGPPVPVIRDSFVDLGGHVGPPVHGPPVHGPPVHGPPVHGSVCAVGFGSFRYLGDQGVKFGFIGWGGCVRIFPIIIPSCRIVDDVFTDAVAGLFVADDVFVIIALP